MEEGGGEETDVAERKTAAASDLEGRKRDRRRGEIIIWHVRQ